MKEYKCFYFVTVFTKRAFKCNPFYYFFDSFYCCHLVISKANHHKKSSLSLTHFAVENARQDKLELLATTKNFLPLPNRAGYNWLVLYQSHHHGVDHWLKFKFCFAYILMKLILEDNASCVNHPQHLIQYRTQVKILTAIYLRRRRLYQRSTFHT